MRACFTVMPLTEAAVDKLIDAVKNVRDQEQKRKAERLLRKVWDAMLRETVLEVPSAILYTIRERMDKAFMRHLGKGTSVEHYFCNKHSSRWMGALDDYMVTVIKEIPAVMRELEDTGVVTHRLTEDERKALKCCVAKMKVLRFIRKDGYLNLPHIPFMTRSVFSHMVSLLDPVNDALLEVSCLFPSPKTDFQGLRRMCD